MDSFAYEKPELLTFALGDSSTPKVSCFVDCTTDNICASVADEICSGSDEVSALKITATSESRSYNGAALTGSYTYNSNALKAGDTLSVTVTGSIQDVGSTTNHVASYQVWRGSSDVTTEYTIVTQDGTLAVVPCSVVMVSDSATKVYDGTPLTASGVTAYGFVAGEGATYTVTGSQTAVGTSENTFTYTFNANTAASNYTVTQEYGSLTVTSAQSKGAISDYNGSGKSDMIQFVNGLVYVTYDDGGKYIQTPAINDITGWNVVEIRRDLTGDGYADIQITAYDGASETWVATLRNDYLVNGCITLNYQFIGAYQTRLWSYLGSADVNSDGKSEVLMVQTAEGADGIYRHVAAWVTDSEGKWVDNVWVGSLTNEWSIAGTADFTGDGEDNILLRRSDGMIGYWRTAGSNDIVLLKNGGDRVMITTGDFDGDGADDFLWQASDGTMSTWTGVAGTMSDTVIGKVSDLGGNWLFAGAGDYNGDGKDEILWCDTTTYKTAYGDAKQSTFANLTVIV